MSDLSFWYPFFLIIHVVVCLFLILLVLLQNDKGGGLAGALGGMGSGAAFSGTSAATVITKVTQVTAIVLFVVILLLNAMSVRKSQGVAVESELKQSKAPSSVLPADLQLGSEGVLPGIPAEPQEAAPAP
jgi:preprotein translocase subunit SecG